MINQKGQSILEYILLTSLIGIFCLAMISRQGKIFKSKLDQMNDRVEKIKIPSIR